MQDRKKTWFYKNKDMSEGDMKKIQQEKLNHVETLECPKSLFTRLPSQLVNIKEIFLNDNNIAEIDLKQLKFEKLEKLEVQRNRLGKITGFNTCPLLINLLLSNNCIK